MSSFGGWRWGVSHQWGVVWGFMRGGCGGRGEAGGGGGGGGEGGLRALRFRGERVVR